MASGNETSFLHVAAQSSNAIFHSSAFLPSLAILFITWIYLPPLDGIKVPTAGFRSPLEPSFLVRLRSASGALPQIHEAYKKYKNQVFRLCRFDDDIFVIPIDQIDAVRNLTADKLDSSKALYRNMVGRYSALGILTEGGHGHIHTAALQTRLTPVLATLTARMKEELDQALQDAVPECKDNWAEISVYELFLTLVTRISNRIFLGQPDCYNKQWAEASMRYAEAFTWTVMILRQFPQWLHPVIAPLIPSTRNVQKNLRLATEVLVPIIEGRQVSQAKGEEKPDDVLQWLMDTAEAEEPGVNDPARLTRWMLLIVLGAAHTTTMAGTHAVYDLTAHPEYLEPLREEVSSQLREEKGWNKTVLSKMKMMDSFLKESQRLSPASLLNFQRFVQTPITLPNGIQLPAGTRICAASYEASADPSAFSPAGTKTSPEFDGFRYFKLRESDPNAANKYQFATTDRHHLHFGHGRYGCPGRFFASDELKMIMGTLILGYEFSFREGEGRPKNLNADEFLYPDPGARLRIRRRR